MRARSVFASLLAVLVLLTSVLAGQKVTTPAPERIPDLARDLASRLEGKSVRIPDGREIPLLGDPRSAPSPILTVDRMVQCLSTVSEAGAWPETWLVVQDSGREFDLVLRIRLGEDGRIVDPDPLFAAPRGEWDGETITAAARAATGKKPPRLSNVVVQSFTTRTETTYVYEPSGADRRAQGLLALLPKGSLIREAKRVDLGDGKLHTLALVLVDARFVPSDCKSCASRAVGHVDTGTVLAVLAGEKALEDKLDLAAELSKAGVRPFLPRYACWSGDDAEEFSKRPVNERFRDRPIAPLLDLVDFDRDGKPREIVLDLALDCERRLRVVLAVASEPPKVRLLEAR